MSTGPWWTREREGGIVLEQRLLAGRRFRLTSLSPCRTLWPS